MALRPFAAAVNWTSTLVLGKRDADRLPGALREMEWARGREKPRRGSAGPSSRRSANRRGGPTPRSRRAEPARRPPGCCCPKVGQPAWPTSSGRRITRPIWAPTAAGPTRFIGSTLLEHCRDGVRVRNDSIAGSAAGRVVEQVIEPGLVYPLLRWGDVERWRARPSAYLLLTQDPQSRHGISLERMQRDYPADAGLSGTSFGRC